MLFATSVEQDARRDDARDHRVVAASIAHKTPRALLRVSSASALGLLASTMPAPAVTWKAPFSQTAVRMAIESYSHVMHIVSEVSGRLREDVDAMAALRASLPAGTLSGAPKIRAMQIIDELEPDGRGPYGGAVGYMSYTGDLDTCIYIRSAVVKDGRVHVQAGAGIVADSNPTAEYEETRDKARALLSALDLAQRGLSCSA